MSIEFTDDLKAQIVLTAISAAGPGAADADVTRQVTRAIGLLSEGSPALRAFEQQEQRANNTEKVASFGGSVLFVDLEQSSSRPVVFLRTQPSEHHPDGIEHVRMDRTDSADGDSVKALAKQATQLVGHKVGVTLRVEKFIPKGSTSSRKVRTLISIEDRGPDETLNGVDISTGHTLIDWTDQARAKMAPNLVRLNRQAQPA